MTDKKLDMYKATVEPNFDSHIERGTIEMNNEYFNLIEEKMARLISENQELKKQLDELQTLYNNMFKYHCNRVQVETLLEQQKEFIEWLEKESKELIRDAGYHQRICLDILEKYKEIIGGKDE